MADVLLHERAAVVAFGQQLVVGTAKHSDVVRGRRASSSEGLFMMKFQSSALLAAFAVRAEVRALVTIAGENLAAHGMRNVP
jgi:hypothetical protein